MIIVAEEHDILLFSNMADNLTVLTKTNIKILFCIFLQNMRKPGIREFRYVSEKNHDN